MALVTLCLHLPILVGNQPLWWSQFFYCVCCDLHIARMWLFSRSATSSKTNYLLSMVLCDRFLLAMPANKSECIHIRWDCAPLWDFPHFFSMELYDIQSPEEYLVAMWWYVYVHVLVCNKCSFHRNNWALDDSIQLNATYTFFWISHFDTISVWKMSVSGFEIDFIVDVWISKTVLFIRFSSEFRSQRNW